MVLVYIKYSTLGTIFQNVYVLTIDFYSALIYVNSKTNKMEIKILILGEIIVFLLFGPAVIIGLIMYYEKQIINAASMIISFFIFPQPPKSKN